MALNFCMRPRHIRRAEMEQHKHSVTYGSWWLVNGYMKHLSMAVSNYVFRMLAQMMYVYDHGVAAQQETAVKSARRLLSQGGMKTQRKASSDSILIKMPGFI